MTKTKQEVKDFLNRVKKLASDAERTQINNNPWAGGKVNKTRQYMAETGITKTVILAVIQELDEKNYSSTKEDKNPRFPDEYVWEFGIRKNLIDKEEELYIKLKIRKIHEEYLLIMSFHPEMPETPEGKLQFPYSCE